MHKHHRAQFAGFRWSIDKGKAHGTGLEELHGKSRLMMAFLLPLEHKYRTQDNHTVIIYPLVRADGTRVRCLRPADPLICMFLQGRALPFASNDPKRRVRAAPAGGLTEDRNDPFRQNHGGSPSGVSAFGQPPVRAFGEARRAMRRGRITVKGQMNASL